jgi:hypothetical protein
MKKRYLIVTDSLGAPRDDAEIISFDESWVGQCWSHLRAKGHEVICITDNGLCAKKLYGMASTKLHLYNADHVILQYGIVDAAPRVLREHEKLLARALRLSAIVQKIAHRYHAKLSNWRDISLHTPERFDALSARTVAHLRNHQPALRITAIEIAPPPASFIAHSPLIVRNVARFNAILKQHADALVHYPENAGDIFLPDGHHLNKVGHNLLFTQLCEVVGA